MVSDAATPPIDHRSPGALARKGSGKEAKLCYAGHVQMDNRYGLVINTRLTGQRHRRT